MRFAATSLHRVGGLLSMGCIFLSAGDARAQEYPTRVVRIIVGEAPGSNSDIIARLIAQKLTEAWGHQVIVDNRPGANQIIGAELVAKAKPDGYTLLTGVVSLLAMNPFVYRKLPYDSLRDFAPITQITTNHFALVVPPTLPATSVSALVKLARARPGEMLYASAGIGNQNHLAMEMFARAADIKLVHVPHKGTAPAVTSLLGGETVMMMLAASPVATHISSGRLRLLATAGTQRAPAFPDVPTLVESGFPDVVVLGGTGLLAPAGTPSDVIDKLAREISRQVSAPEVRSALAARGTDLARSSPDAYAAFIRSEMAKWSKIIRLVGLENTQ